MIGAMASEAWKHELAAVLGARVASAEPVPGGDINDAYRVTLGDGRVVFVKAHADPPPGMFAAEARGLDWLRAGPLRVPEVIAAGDRFLALEWLELDERRDRRFDEELGRGLAGLHRTGAPGFGLDHDNFPATLPQANAPRASWPELWIDARLMPLVSRAHREHRMPDVRAKLDRLRSRSDRFGPPEPPARLHGDLWWGNVVAAGGQPVIVDPAVYGGHREVDLAMLALFGGLPDRLVAAYTEAFPLADGWRDRVPLWQLYPLAAHAVLFGGGYGARVARALDAIV
jgi:fructosamine-3-kinase